MTPEDRTLWRMVTRTVAALRPHAVEAEEAEIENKPVPVKKEKPKEASLTVSPRPKQPQGQEVDIRTLARLRRGQMPIDATIDLHGHSVQQAYLALRDFVRTGFAKGARCVLVIHGKGSLTGEAKIKNALAGWLAEWPDAVLAHAPGKPEHGGTGVTYVLLRRKRL